MEKFDKIKKYISSSIARPPQYKLLSSNSWDWVSIMYVAGELNTPEKPQLLDIFNRTELSRINALLVKAYILKSPKEIEENFIISIGDLVLPTGKIGKALERLDILDIEIMLPKEYTKIDTETGEQIVLTKTEELKITFKTPIVGTILKTIKIPILKTDTVKAVILDGEAYFVPENAYPNGRFIFSAKNPSRTRRAASNTKPWSLAMGNRASTTTLDFNKVNHPVVINYSDGTAMINNELSVVFDQIQRIVGGPHDDKIVGDATKINSKHKVTLDGVLGNDEFDIKGGDITITDQTGFITWRNSTINTLVANDLIYKYPSIKECPTGYWCNELDGSIVKAKKSNGGLSIDLTHKDGDNAAISLPDFKNGKTLGINLVGDSTVSSATSQSGILIETRNLISNWLNRFGEKIGLVSEGPSKEIKDFTATISEFANTLPRDISYRSHTMKNPNTNMYGTISQSALNSSSVDLIA